MKPSLDDLRYVVAYGLIALLVVVTAAVFGVAVHVFLWAAGW